MTQKKGVRPLPILILAGLLTLFLVRNGGWILDTIRTPDSVDAREKILLGLSQENEIIYLQQYDLTQQDLARILNDLSCSQPELFFVGCSSYSCTIWMDRVLSLTPTYWYRGAERERLQEQYQQAIAEIIAPIDEDWSDLETALYLHDYMAAHYAYDESQENFTAYQLLTEHTGICQAYTLTYQALMQAAGLECRYVLSDEMDHSWNAVFLDGAWYHVDITFDDPIFDRLGKVGHQYFLLSDAMIARDHPGDYTGPVCASDRYDRALWNTVSTGFVPVDGVFYCISGNQLCRWDAEKLTPLYTIPERWIVDGTAHNYWDGCFSSLDTDGAALYFNVPDAVKRYDPTTGELCTVYTHTGEGDLYGFLCQKDGTALIQTAESPNDPGQLQRIPINQ